MEPKSNLRELKEYSPYQFSFFRMLLGAYLCIYFAGLLPWFVGEGRIAPVQNIFYGIIPNILPLLSSPMHLIFFIGTAIVFSVLFFLGFQRRILALFLWYAWICLFNTKTLINGPEVAYVGWFLLYFALLPKGEPLALSSGKESTKWVMPKMLFTGAWLLLAVAYAISGSTKLQTLSWQSPAVIIPLLEIAFLPLALFRFTRKWIWAALLTVQIGRLLLTNNADNADFAFILFLIHCFTFDARWLPAKSKNTGIVFFDGVCGMCNNLVDRMLSEDREETLRFAPLQGETAKAALKEADYKDVNSIVYLEGAQVYKESDAVLRALAALGGIWRITLLFLVVPTFLRNKVYQFVAQNRYRWFGKKEACRLPTPAERMRILR